MNHHPLELINQTYLKTKITIRETVRIVGNYAYCENQCLVSVTITPSIESIGNSAFYYCINLKYIEFKGKSNLKKMGNLHFSTQISTIIFPSNVELIGNFSF